MNIAIIPSADLSYNSGSIIYAKKLYKYLLKHNHNAYLLGSKKPLDISSGMMRNIIIDNSLLEHPIIDDRAITSEEYINSLNVTLKYLIDLSKSSKIDIIHAHYASFTSFAAFIASGLLNVPYLISSFGRDINIGYKADTRIKWFIDKSYLSASKIIVPDENMTYKIINIFGPQIKSKLDVIPMPLDSDIFNKGTLSIDDKRPIIATINSCFSPEKGIDFIIKAFSKMNKEIDCQLVIAGTDDHPDQIHRKYLEGLVQELGLIEDVKFTGYLNRNNVGDLLRSARCLVDGRTQGNFSSVLIEALFNKTPVISSINDASKKIITHGLNGLLFSSSKEEELILCLNKLFYKNDLAKTLIVNMEKWGNENSHLFLEEENFKKIVEIYNQILEEKINVKNWTSEGDY